MSTNLELIKKIREKTGAGIVMVKKALEESKGDEKKAIEIIRKKGQERAMKKSARSVKEGIIATYVHSNKKIGAIVELFCETDFVAKNSEFQALGQDLAMQIAATGPQYLKPEDVSEKEIEKEKEIWKEQLLNVGKNPAVIEKALEGKVKKFREEISLLSQPFIKDNDLKVEDLIKEKIAKIGENIQIGKFERFEL